ncbi:hypothetical protein [Colwellia psychrerythraea]|uniref:Putative membrane protein n=1 Tax=Colwellia psychrerythraea (strain 34H / ATCC BAA-681) TaxID=167879 RepID=Q481G2_COLP3|nr:hypothetical protein [Colwellia psychrerythraea]AAZ26574.1 putative membrane protein [Colwellia psychrerythraea 34H]
MKQNSDEYTKLKQKIDRRTATDFWSYAQITLVILSWLLFIVALVMSYYAAPDKDYGVLRYYDIEIRQFWLTPLTGYLYILLWLSALGSYLALMTDRYRSRRRSDAPLGNLIFLLAVNLTWLVYILVKVQ